MESALAKGGSGATTRESQENSQTCPPLPGYNPGLEGLGGALRRSGRASSPPPLPGPQLRLERSGGALRQEGKEVSRPAQEDPQTSPPSPGYNPGLGGSDGALRRPGRSSPTPSPPQSVAFRIDLEQRSGGAVRTSRGTRQEGPQDSLQETPQHLHHLPECHWKGWSTPSQKGRSLSNGNPFRIRVKPKRRRKKACSQGS